MDSDLRRMWNSGGILEAKTMARLGAVGRSGLLRRPVASMRLTVTTIIGIVLGFMIGNFFPPVIVSKLHFPSGVVRYIDQRNSGLNTQSLLNRVWTTLKNWDDDLTKVIYICSYDNILQDRDWKKAMDEEVEVLTDESFSEDFAILLFHYDGRTSEWDEFEWSKRAIHDSARKQTKWWFAKRFLHPDIVAPYDYIFIWDEDLGVEHFNAEQYIALVKKHGLEISQPGLEPDKGLTWQMTKRRGDREVHKGT